MEKDKQAKPRIKILKFLPKAASAVNFQNLPFSPSRDKRRDSYSHKASMISEQIRRNHVNNGSLDKQEEPTSPKVSCMGQVKQKKKMCKAKPASKKTFMRFFSSSKLGRRSESDACNVNSPMVQPVRAPSISQLKRFASGLDGFVSFDWTAGVAEVEPDHRNYYSDEEEEEEEVIVPFSAPITVIGGVALQPRKEINLWKRRTMNPPRPLQLNSMVRPN